MVKIEVLHVHQVLKSLSNLFVSLNDFSFLSALNLHKDKDKHLLIFLTKRKPPITERISYTFYIPNPTSEHPTPHRSADMCAIFHDLKEVL
ncbi:MAG TPA: hypothetical protein VL022_04785 [Moheibacter sp.]|nr:hypothetical protein [Moheibacter sp.]